MPKSSSKNAYRAGNNAASETLGRPDTGEESRWSKYLPLLAGAGTMAVGGPLAYKHLRKFRPSSYSSLRSVQEAALAGGDHLTRVSPDRLPVGRLKQELARIRMSADKVVYRMSDGARAKEKVPGAVRNFAHGEDVLVKGREHTGSTPGTAEMSAVIGENKWQEYLFFNRHAPGSMPKTENMADILQSSGRTGIPTSPEGRAEMLKELEATLRSKYPDGYVMKEINGVQSGGAFPTDADDLSKLYTGFDSSGIAADVRRAASNNYGDFSSAGEISKTIKGWTKDPTYSGRVLDQLLSNPAQTIVQARRPIEKPGPMRSQVGKWFGSPPSKEVRVHVEAGKAVEGLAMPRFDPTMQFLDRDKIRGATNYAQDIVDKLPAEYRNKATFAMDIAPLEGGGYTMLESNAGGQSGLLHKNPIASIKLRQALTGKLGPVASGSIALGGAAAAGGAVAGGTALGQSILDANG